MSRLDIVTIVIVVVCIAALIFLIYKTTNLLGGDEPAVTAGIENSLRDTAGEEEDLYPIKNNGELAADDSNESGASGNDDLDDDELASSEDEFLEEEDSSEGEIANEPIDDGTPEDYTSSPGDSYGKYLVLAGSYRIKGNAENEAKKMKGLGYTEAEVTLFNQGVYAAVLVKRFENNSEARALVKELKNKHGIESYVHVKRRSTN